MAQRWPALAGLALFALACAPAAPRPVALAPETKETPILEEAFEWRLPPGFPIPTVPPTNPMSEVKVALGRHLFYDPRLSGNGTYSCASCHQQEFGFTDGIAVAVGSTGEQHRLSTMPLANVAYTFPLTWADPELRELEQQSLVPMFNETPVELGLSGQEQRLTVRLAAVPEYREWFAQAFPREQPSIQIKTISKALAAFQRTLISGDSPYDRWVFRGESDAVSPQVKRGMELFHSERLRCNHCHSGINFAGPQRSAEGSPLPVKFLRNGLAPDRVQGHRGLVEQTKRRRDRGRFRVPTLRNIERTAPYMHDGRFATLDDVVAHYASGGHTGKHAFEVTPEEQHNLIAFLNSLTDEVFLNNPEFADPCSASSPSTSELCKR